MDISCQGPLRKIEEGSDAVDQPFAVRLDQLCVEVHRLTGGESLPFHREVFLEDNLPRNFHNSVGLLVCFDDGRCKGEYRSGKSGLFGSKHESTLK